MHSNPLLEQSLRLGMEALRQQRWSDALHQGRIAVSQAPGHAAAHHLLGLALLQLGEPQAAVNELQRALAQQRRDAPLTGHLAQAYAASGQHDQAHDHFRRAERLAPGHWPFRLGAAIALAQQGRHAEAEALLRRLSEQYPEQPMILFNLGHARLELGQHEAAEHSLRATLRLTPQDPDARLDLGITLHRQLRFAEAITEYRECSRLHPDWPVPRLNLISALIDDGNFAEAVTQCGELIARAPQLPEAHRFLGAALGHQGRLLEALQAHAECARLQPRDAAALRSLAGALADCGHLHAAWRTLARANALEPQSAAASQLRSMMALAAGQFGDGWSAYRSRPSHASLSQKWPHPRSVQELPEDLAGLHLLVRREQGLGDELFFLRYLPALRAGGARVSVCVSEPLQAMIARNDCADATLAGDAEAPADTDAQIFCGDLAHAIAVRPCSMLPAREAPPCTLPDYAAAIRVYLPQPQPSLRLAATDDALQRMRQRLREAGPPPYLALTWRAGTAARDQGGGGWLLSKHIDPRALAAAVSGHCGSLIAIQRRPAAGELQALSRACSRPLADFTAVNDNLEDMLALMQLVDDYVGVSNTNMHLRAACNRSARVLVPNPAEWRWLQQGNESPWFPGFTLYRQSPRGDWAQALARLAQDLAPPPDRANI